MGTRDSVSKSLLVGVLRMEGDEALVERISCLEKRLVQLERRLLTVEYKTRRKKEKERSRQKLRDVKYCLGL